MSRLLLLARRSREAVVRSCRVTGVVEAATPGRELAVVFFACMHRQSILRFGRRGARIAGVGGSRG